MPIIGDNFTARRCVRCNAIIPDVRNNLCIICTINSTPKNTKIGDFPITQSELKRETMVIYTLGEVIDKLKIDEFAICVKGASENIGTKMYYNNNRELVINGEEFNIVLSADGTNENTKLRFIIVDKG